MELLEPPGRGPLAHRGQEDHEDPKVDLGVKEAHGGRGGPTATVVDRAAEAEAEAVPLSEVIGASGLSGVVGAVHALNNTTLAARTLATRSERSGRALDFLHERPEHDSMDVKPRLLASRPSTPLRWQRGILRAVLVLAAFLTWRSAASQESLRRSLDDTEVAGNWVYDDWERARQLAAGEHKPILAVFRCVL